MYAPVRLVYLKPGRSSDTLHISNRDCAGRDQKLGLGICQSSQSFLFAEENPHREREIREHQPRRSGGGGQTTALLTHGSFLVASFPPPKAPDLELFNLHSHQPSEHVASLQKQAVLKGTFAVIASSPNHPFHTALPCAIFSFDFAWNFPKGVALDGRERVRGLGAVGG